MIAHDCCHHTHTLYSTVSAHVYSRAASQCIYLISATVFTLVVTRFFIETYPSPCPVCTIISQYYLTTVDTMRG